MLDGKQLKPASVSAAKVDSTIQTTSNIDNDGTLSSNSAIRAPSVAAVKTYVAARGGGASIGVVYAMAARQYTFY